MKRLLFIFFITLHSLVSAEGMVTAEPVRVGVSGEHIVKDSAMEDGQREEAMKDRSVVDGKGNPSRGSVVVDPTGQHDDFGTREVVDVDSTKNAGGIDMTDRSTGRESVDEDSSGDHQVDAKKEPVGQGGVVDSSSFESSSVDPTVEASKQSRSLVKRLKDIFSALQFHVARIFNKLSGRTAQAESDLQEIANARRDRQVDDEKDYNTIVTASKKAVDALQRLDALKDMSDKSVQKKSSHLTEQVINDLAEVVVKARLYSERSDSENVVDHGADNGRSKSSINREVQLMLTSLDPAVASKVMDLANDTLSGLIPEGDASKRDYHDLKQRSLQYHEMIEKGAQRYELSSATDLLAEVGRQPLANASTVLVDVRNPLKQSSSELALDSLRAGVDAIGKIGTSQGKAALEILQDATSELSYNASRSRYQTADTRESILERAPMRLRSLGTGFEVAMDMVEKSATAEQKAKAQKTITSRIGSQSAEQLLEGSKPLVKSGYSDFMSKLSALGDGASRARGVQEFLSDELGVEVGELSGSRQLEHLYDRVALMKEQLSQSGSNAEQVQALDKLMTGMKSIDPFLTTPMQFELLLNSTNKEAVLLTTYSQFVAKTTRRLYSELQTAPVVEPVKPSKKVMKRYESALSEYNDRYGSARGAKPAKPVSPMDIYNRDMERYDAFTKRAQELSSQNAAEKAQADKEVGAVSRARAAHESAGQQIRQLFGESGEGQVDSSVTTRTTSVGGIDGLVEAGDSGEPTPEDKLVEIIKTKLKVGVPESVVRSQLESGGMGGTGESYDAAQIDAAFNKIAAEKSADKDAGDKDAVSRPTLPSDLSAQIRNRSAASSADAASGELAPEDELISTIKAKLKAGLPERVVRLQLESGGMGGAGKSYETVQIDEAFEKIKAEDKANQAKLAAEQNAQRSASLDLSKFEEMKQRGTSDAVIRMQMRSAGATDAQIDQVLSQGGDGASGKGGADKEPGSLLDAIKARGKALTDGSAHKKDFNDMSQAEQIENFDSLSSEDRVRLFFRLQGAGDRAEASKISSKLTPTEKLTVRRWKLHPEENPDYEDEDDDDWDPDE